ncbi:hypothetical protein PRIPAC_89769 [Pristionchus pacificus]|uniref:Uncharacterized protein n=1 Tax=Pristionchus pacificus TaxID=54126 RepID=A0A2A6CVL2_PRIPA|nr:hypothetical protein PRIPAC_89769 [Pristionchus pacificus]|eukprot:PDM82140.1 hypothetical protein PRIPAC_36533 [Pristionchus pacificus]
MILCDVLILYKVWNMRLSSMLAAAQNQYHCLDPHHHLAISDHSHTVNVVTVRRGSIDDAMSSWLMDNGGISNKYCNDNRSMDV